MGLESKSIVEGVYDAAISAAARDATVVSIVVDVLNQEGLNVFDWAKDSSELWGQSIPAAIEQLLANQVGSVVVFLSQAYSESTWCRQELDLIHRVRKGTDGPSILPVRLDASEVPQALRDIVWLDATALDPKEVGKKLAAAIRTNVTAARRTEQALDDDSLARKAISERDPQAFSLLAQRLVPFGYSIARRYGASEMDTDDIVQDALAMLFTRSHQLDLSGRSIQHYFALIVRNKVVDSFRAKAHRRETQIGRGEEFASPDASSQAEQQEMLSEVKEALKSLSESERSVLLYLLEDRSSSETAAQFGVSSSTLRRQVHRALEKLRAAIAGREQSHGT